MALTYRITCGIVGIRAVSSDVDMNTPNALAVSADSGLWRARRFRETGRKARAQSRNRESFRPGLKGPPATLIRFLGRMCPLRPARLERAVNREEGGMQ